MQDFTFNRDSFNNIFPFFFLLDSGLTVKSLGKSIAKLYPDIAEGEDFTTLFRIKRPFIDTITTAALNDNLTQLVILESRSGSDVLIRGQFEKLGECFLFIGSPWFVSIEEIKQKKLSILDFANYDPLLDLLQLIKTQEITTLELRNLLTINTNQREELRKDREELNRLSMVASSNNKGIVFTTPDAKIFWCNDAYIEQTGFTREEVIGKTPVEIGNNTAIDEDALQAMIDRFYNGIPFDVEITHGRKDGSYFWTRTQGQPVYGEDGQLLQFFAMIEDMSDRRELQQQKEELLESLEKSNKELEDYAQIVSHDLKSPLRSINSLIAWIKEENEGALSDQTSLYFSMIENKLEKMDSLIQGVLTYSRIDKADVNKERINLDEIVRNIVSIIDIPANITVAVDKILPTILADRYRMHQLFQNLIGNAVAYIDKPQGVVNIGFTESKTAYTFYVKDNGPGIAAENHEKIFKIFQSLVKNERSTGLGLSIVKKIADNYKGRVWLESELKQGTTFFIELPKK